MSDQLGLGLYWFPGLPVWLFGLFLDALVMVMLLLLLLLDLLLEAELIVEKLELLLDLRHLPAQPVYLLVQLLVLHSGLMLAAVTIEIMLGKLELEDLLSADLVSGLRHPLPFQSLNPQKSGQLSAATLVLSDQCLRHEHLRPVWLFG